MVSLPLCCKLAIAALAISADRDRPRAGLRSSWTASVNQMNTVAAGSLAEGEQTRKS
jgi:hypothetical protein